jgi:hypothetical protein
MAKVKSPPALKVWPLMDQVEAVPMRVGVE